jgi:DNA-binding MarR family transcriptional regulator
MEQVKLFREYTRELECHLAAMNQSDCCQCGINESQCFLVVEIGRKPGISVKELAENVGLDKSGISRGVEELVRKGFVNRETSKEDRRSVELTLTDSGNARFEKIENDMNLKFRKVLFNIDADQRDQVLEALRIYNEACRKAEQE